LYHAAPTGRGGECKKEEERKMVETSGIKFDRRTEKKEV
jgi:hypothetical protein